MPRKRSLTSTLYRAARFSNNVLPPHVVQVRRSFAVNRGNAHLRS